MAEPIVDTQVFISGFGVEYLNGDESYLVTVFYKNTNGQITPIPDKFSFSTSAKLKKFITNYMLRTEDTEDATPATAS